MTKKTQKQRLEALVENIKDVFKKDRTFQIELATQEEFSFVTLSTLFRFELEDIVQISKLLTKIQQQGTTMYSKDGHPHIRILVRTYRGSR